MAGLEGAPSAVESHLHRGEGQVGDKIFAALRVAVLHLGGDGTGKLGKSRNLSQRVVGVIVELFLRRKSCMS